MAATDTKTILLVDDDSFLLDMYSMKFNKEGYEVEAIGDPQAALETLRDGYEPHIVLLDIIMPDMSGLDLLKTMRDENLAPDAVVVMLTNEGQKESIDTAKKNGATGYIIKASTPPSQVVEEVEAMYADVRPGSEE